MRDSAKQLRNKIGTERLQDIEDESEDEDSFARVAVTVDGTWQERGHSSKI